MEEKTNLPAPKRNNDLISGAMILPTIDMFTDQKIDTAVNEVYKGYSRANPDAMKTLEQVVQYIRGREEAHSKTMAAGITTAIKIRAVVSACRWDLGYIIDRAMQNTEFGDKVAPTLAKELGLDESDIVGIRSIHNNMTRAQAYVMGLYGIPTAKLIQVASIQDKNIREKLIDTCCGHPLDLTDSASVSRHMNKIQNAIRAALLPQSPSIETSEETDDDGEEGETVLDVIPDSVHDAVKTLETLEGMLKPFRESKLDSDVCRLSAVNPDSLDTGKEAIKQMIDIIREKVAFLTRDLNNVEDIIREYREAVDSLAAVFCGGLNDLADSNDTAAEE